MLAAAGTKTFEAAAAELDVTLCEASKVPIPYITSHLTNENMAVRACVNVCNYVKMEQKAFEFR